MPSSLRLPLLALIASIVMMTPSLAQTPSRYSFQTVEGGVMRLDTETGQISICNRSAGDFVCRSVADDRAALDEEITKLKRENAILRQSAATSPTTQPKLSLPTEEEFDKAMGLFERMMRRMMRTFKDEPQPPNRL